MYVDESGIDHRMTKAHCWTRKGHKLIGERRGKYRKRTSVLAALNGDESRLQLDIVGTANTDLFLYWLEKFLGPILKKGQVVIMDNCPIHKSLKVRNLIEEAGVP